MLQTIGKCKELLGNSVYKAVLLRHIGKGRYMQVARHYYAADEEFWKYKGALAFELHPENTCKEVGQTKISYIDIERGTPVAMGDGNTVVHSPQALFKMLAGEHIKQAGKSVMGGNTNLIMCLLCVGVGIAIGFIVGQNLPAITGALAGKPTPTPPFHP